MDTWVNIEESFIESRILWALQFGKGSHKDNNLWEFKGEIDLWGIPNIKAVGIEWISEDWGDKNSWIEKVVN